MLNNYSLGLNWQWHLKNAHACINVTSFETRKYLDLNYCFDQLTWAHCIKQNSSMHTRM